MKNKILQFPQQNNETENRSKFIKMAVSIVAAIFIVLLYSMIFFFSDQDGETSGSLSHKVTEKIVIEFEEIAHKNWTDELRAAIIRYWENPVRKLAHFSEYAVLGICVFVLLIPWVTDRGWREKKIKWNLTVILWVFLSACVDEWHQTFVSERCGNFLDVLLDTSGGCFGLCICLIVMFLFRLIVPVKNTDTSI